MVHFLRFILAPIFWIWEIWNEVIYVLDRGGSCTKIMILSERLTEELVAYKQMHDIIRGFIAKDGHLGWEMPRTKQLQQALSKTDEEVLYPIWAFTEGMELEAYQDSNGNTTGPFNPSLETNLKNMSCHIYLIRDEWIEIRRGPE